MVIIQGTMCPNDVGILIPYTEVGILIPYTDIGILIPYTIVAF